MFGGRMPPKKVQAEDIFFYEEDKRQRREPLVMSDAHLSSLLISMQESQFEVMLDCSPSDDDPFVFRINDNGTGPNLLVEVCMERGWRGYQPGTGAEDQWNLWWRNGSFPLSQQKELHKWQFTNHIPKGGSICRKDNLSRLLRCMRKIYGSIYDFSPASYHLPLEYTKLVAECSHVRRSCQPGCAPPVWICKPVAQSQGRGIFLFRNLCELRYASTALVQCYIERPLLVGGYKCDLRLYVCVPAYRPLTAYMYCEGLARFGTDKYTLNDIHNPYRHLTNCSLNKAGPRYAECKDRIGSGCKWTLNQLRRHLCGTCRDGGSGGDMASGGGAEWLAWQRVRALVTLTLLSQVSGVPPVHNCFEFFGFDVLLDELFKPWLIEVNSSPALAHDCEADAAVKRPMLHDLFDLLGLPMRHTGIALYAALARPRPATQVHDNGDESDTENVDTTANPGVGVKAGRIGESQSCGCGRWRRRRAKDPLKSIVIQPSATTVNAAALQVDPQRHSIKPHTSYSGGATSIACNVREAVAAVAQFGRAAREAARTTGAGAGAAGDKQRSAALEQAYGQQIEIWLPPR